MTSYLQQIIEHVRERNEAMKAALGPNDTGRLIASRPDTPRGFAAAVSPSTDKTLIIGEIKRRSPSVGVIREDRAKGDVFVRVRGAWGTGGRRHRLGFV